MLNRNYNIRAMLKRSLRESSVDVAKECVRYLRGKGYEKVYGTWTPRRINGAPAEYSLMFVDASGQYWHFFTSDFRWNNSPLIIIRKTSGPRDFRGEDNISIRSVDDLKRLGL